MQDQNPLTSAERELEAALAGLKPAAVASTRDELLFRAGQRSVAPRLWIWRGATLAAAATVALVIFLRPALVDRQHIVYVDRVVEKREIVPVAATPTPASEQPTMHIDARDFRLRQRILRFGLDAMPTQISAAPVHDSLDRAIGIPRSDLGVGELLLRHFGQTKGGL